MIFHHDNVAVIRRISDERTGAADMMHETYRLEKFIRRKRSSDENSMGKTLNETIYDENALKLLKQKIVLAYILSYTVKEFYTMDIDSIAHCIEGEPEIHKTAVDERGQDISDFVAPMISGKDPNRKSRQEGNVLFDLLFDVLVPDRNETIKLSAYLKKWLMLRMIMSGCCAYLRHFFIEYEHRREKRYNCE